MGTRVLPEKKQKQKPQLSILPPVAEEERGQLENEEAQVIHQVQRTTATVNKKQSKNNKKHLRTEKMEVKPVT